MVKKLKDDYSSILQKHTNWGKSDKYIELEAEKIYNIANFNDIQLEEFKKMAKIRPKTVLLTHTNKIKSDVEIDRKCELPIIELFLDDSNFVVFTTKGIYSCRAGVITNLVYNNISNIDENSLQKFGTNNHIRFMDLGLITKDKKTIPVKIEYGIPFRPIIVFLDKIIK